MSSQRPSRSAASDPSLAALRRLFLSFAAVALVWLVFADDLVALVAPVRPSPRLFDLLVGAALLVTGGVWMSRTLRRLERDRDEAELRHTRALRQQARSAYLLQVLADNSPDAIFVKDREGRYLLFNRAAAAMLDMRPEAVLGRDDAALFPGHAPQIRARDQALMQLDRPATFEEELDTPTGRRTFLTTKGPLHDPLQGSAAIGLFGIARDVTERAQARQRLEHSELRYRLAAAGGFVWDWDIEQRRTEAQSGFWQGLGYEPPPGRAAFERLPELMHADDLERWRRAVRAHLVQRRPYDLEFRARHRDGHWRWFHTQGQAVWNAQGRATYMAGTTFDITERREAEAALERTRRELSDLLQRLMEQERETTQRLAQALHDRLGQVLSGARLQLDLAVAQAGTPPARLERVSSMLDEAIGEVRRVMVALRPPLLREQGLAAALDNEVRRSAAGGLPVAVHLERSAAAVFARWPERVEHAAFMIAREGLANALVHAQARTVRVCLDGDGDWLELRVADDGRGIDDGERQGRPGHLGLVGMRERAVSIDAVLDVARGVQGGTTVHLLWRGGGSK